MRRAGCAAARLRRRADHVGLVFQMYNLLPVLTAERNVELPLLLKDLTRQERAHRTVHLDKGLLREDAA